MKTKELFFDLPPNLIAQYPTDKRGNERLLCINRKTGEWRDDMFSSLPDLLPRDCVLVLNDSKVRKARVFVKSETGASVELLFVSRLSLSSWKCMASRTKRRKENEVLFLDNIKFTILKIEDGMCVISSSEVLDDGFFEKYGHVPLPPYIRREDEFSDERRYNTIYAKNLGSVASPTAGLHYTQDIMDRIKKRGIEVCPITLHVGLGTFLPLRTENIEDHHMHSEEYEISKESADIINKALSENRPIVASGTTSLRCIESAYDVAKKQVRAERKSTDIFIKPGYEFKVISKLITNFHTPESTLLALVAAFSSLEIVKKAYSHAIDEKYMFFSYGDATYWY